MSGGYAAWWGGDLTAVILENKTSDDVKLKLKKPVCIHTRPREHTRAQIYIQRHMALFGVPSRFSALEWTAWQLLEDERTHNQTHIHTHSERCSRAIRVG